MRVRPHNNYLLCRQIQKQFVTSEFGTFTTQTEQIPIYEIVDVPSTSDCLRYTIGDVIISNSTGTKIPSETAEMYLIDVNTIIAKIEKEN